MTPNDIFIAAIIVIVVLTLIAFIYVQYVKYNSKASSWNWLNLLAGITILLTLNSIIPQYFLFDRTDAECYFLHHWSLSFYNITNGLARLFFQCRSNQIAPDTKRDTLIGNLMASVIVCVTVIGIILNNMTLSTMVIGNLCVGIPGMLSAFLFVLFVPMFTDIAINIRFFSHLLQSTQQVVGAASKKHTKAPFRLLKVTCVLCISCTAMSFICMTFLFGFLPVQNQAWVTVVLAGEQAYNACAVAWPSIYIFVRKRVKAYVKSNSTRTAKANELKSTPKLPTPENDSTRIEAVTNRQ